MKHHKLYEGRILTEPLWTFLLIFTLIGSVFYMVIVTTLNNVTSALFCATFLIVICIMEISFILNSRHYRIIFFQDGIEVPTVSTSDPDAFDVQSFKRASVRPHFFYYSDVEKIIPFYYGIRSPDADYIGLKIILKSNNQHNVAFIERTNLRISAVIHLLGKEKRWDEQIGSAEPIGIDKSTYNRLWKRIAYELQILTDASAKRTNGLTSDSVVSYSESWSKYFQKTYKDILKTYLFIFSWAIIGIILVSIYRDFLIRMILDPLGYNQGFIQAVIPFISLFIFGTGLYGLILLPTERFGPFKIDNENICLPHINSSFLYDFPKIFTMGREFLLKQIIGILVENNYILFYIVSKEDLLQLHIIRKYYFVDSKDAIRRIQMIGIPVSQNI